MTISKKLIGILKQPPPPLWDHSQATTLHTQFGAYGDRLECEPCVFPITVALSDIAISPAPSRGRL